MQDMPRTHKLVVSPMVNPSTLPYKHVFNKSMVSRSYKAYETLHVYSQMHDVAQASNACKVAQTAPLQAKNSTFELQTFNFR
jgi:hypothetical protein